MSADDDNKPRPFGVVVPVSFPVRVYATSLEQAIAAAKQKVEQELKDHGITETKIAPVAPDYGWRAWEMSAEDAERLGGR